MMSHPSNPSRVRNYRLHSTLLRLDLLLIFLKSFLICRYIIEPYFSLGDNNVCITYISNGMILIIIDFPKACSCWEIKIVAMKGWP